MVSSQWPKNPLLPKPFASLLASLVEDLLCPRPFFEQSDIPLRVLLISPHLRPMGPAASLGSKPVSPWTFFIANSSLEGRVFFSGKLGKKERKKSTKLGIKKGGSKHTCAGVLIWFISSQESSARAASFDRLVARGRGENEGREVATPTRAQEPRTSTWIARIQHHA